MTLRKLVGGWTAILWLSATVVLAQDQPSIVGFSVAQKDEKSEFGHSFIPGLNPGTQAYLRVALPDHTILKIDSDKSSLEIRDSKGKTLEANEHADIGFYSTIAEDRHSAIVPVQSPDIPSAGATTLAVSGTLVCQCGADLKKETVDVSLEENSEVKLGPVTAKVLSITDGFEPGSKRVELEGKVSFDQLQSLVFIGANGKRLEATSAGGGSFGFAGDMTYSKSYQIEGDVSEVAKAEVSYFQKVEEVKVDVDVQAGLDLAK